MNHTVGDIEMTLVNTYLSHLEPVSNRHNNNPNPL